MFVLAMDEDLNQRELARNVRILCYQSRQLLTFELFTSSNTFYAVSYFCVADSDISEQ